MDIVTFDGLMGATAATQLKVGPVFYPGNYGAKGVYTEADMGVIAAKFQGFDVNVEHRKSPLDGKLGKIVRMWPDVDERGQKALFGEWEQPEPLSALLGSEPVKVSIELNKNTKEPVGMAMTHNPHVTGAQFFSAVEDAYEKFSKGEDIVPFAYETATERDAIPLSDFGDPDNKLFPVRTQEEYRASMRELSYAKDPTAVKNRILQIAQVKGLDTKDSQWPYYQTPGISAEISDDKTSVSMYSQEKPMEKTFLQNLLALVTQAKPEEIAQAEQVVAFSNANAAMAGAQRLAAQAEPVVVTAPVDAEKEALKTRLQEIEDANEAARVAKFSADAEAAADELVKARKIKAKGNQAHQDFVAMFTIASRYDNEREDLAYFSKDSALAKFSAVEYLKCISGNTPAVEDKEVVGDLSPEAAAALSGLKPEHVAVFEREDTEVVGDPNAVAAVAQAAVKLILEQNKAAAEKK